MTEYDAHRRKRYRLAVEANGGRPLMVDPAPLRAHLTQLRAAGMTLQQIYDACECSSHAVWSIDAGRTKRVFADTAKCILAVQVPEDLPRFIVPSYGARRRVQALMTLGYSLVYIGQEAGVSEKAFTGILRKETISRPLHEAIVAVYDRLEAIPRSGHQASRTRRLAARRGFAPPAAWDDIDDPNERPKGLVRPNHAA